MENKTLVRPAPFNPLDKTNLGESVADAMLQQPVGLLPPESAFVGAGIYALYYIGDFPLYRQIAERNLGDRFDLPIYVGKAVPAGARKGGQDLAADPGQVLFKRLKEHAESIGQVENLNLADFRCRFLVVDDIWIPLGESLLIQMFSPIWNSHLDGFGNHDPGAGRQKQQRSPWDEIHPGRPWASKLQPRLMHEDALREAVDQYIRSRPR